MPRASSLGSLAALTLTLTLTRGAHANGRFPATNQLIVDPGDPSHIVVRATYGVLSSTDAGKTFRWLCEQAVGYSGATDPMLGVLQGGTIVAGVIDGLSASQDRGCTFRLEPGFASNEYVIDVVVQKDDPSHALVISSSAKAGGGFSTVLVETTDGGATWAATGAALGDDFLALTVEVAPSDPKRVYVSGLVGQQQTPTIARSQDRGATWTRVALDPLGAQDGAWIAAVDPQNPDRVYARLDGEPADHVIVSDDAATTWRDVYDSKGPLAGFALSPDGSSLAIGGPDDGVRIARASDLAFSPASAVRAKCLTWTSAGIYACGTESSDAFTIGLSKDEGKTFTALHHLGDPCPLACASGSSVATKCTAGTWEAARSLISPGKDACSAGGGGSSGSDAGAEKPPTPEPTQGGCAMAAGEPAPFACVAISALALAARRARRRGRGALGRASGLADFAARGANSA